MMIGERISRNIETASPETRTRWFFSAVLVCSALVVALWIVYFSSILSLKELPAPAAGGLNNVPGNSPLENSMGE